MTTPLPPPTDILPFPSRPDDTLRLSLRRLEAALAEQGRAVAEWRAALGTLDAAMGGMREEMLAYHSGLASAAIEIDRAHAAAQTLEATADAMLERARHATGGA